MIYCIHLNYYISIRMDNTQQIKIGTLILNPNYKRSKFLHHFQVLFTLTINILITIALIKAQGI